MPKCPRCKEEIEELTYVTTGAIEYSLVILKHRKKQIPHYEQGEFKGDGVVEEWQCPECCECLFYDELAAVDFLQQ